MIRKISFKNFYSFHDSFEMSFLATKKTTFDYVQSEVDKYQISKVATIIGGNASGKTNIVRVFKFLQTLLSRKISGPMENITQQPLPYHTFFSNNDTVEINVEFERSAKIFFYTLKMERNIIILEQLKIKSFGKNIRSVFKRSDTLELSKVYFKNIDRRILPNIRNDVSIISFFRSLPFKIEIIEDLDTIFSSLLWQVNMNESDSHLKNTDLSSFLYTEDPEISESMQDFISRFDIGLKSFKITDNGSWNYDIKGVHGDKILDFYFESRGTKTLYSLLAPILVAMKFRGLVVIDELETGLHPEAVEKLISYFLSESEGEMCQFIFSTHSINVLNKLDREQIFIVDKNDKGESRVYSVADIEISRPDENLMKKYMSGKYGGFPKIKV